MPRLDEPEGFPFIGDSNLEGAGNNPMMVHEGYDKLRQSLRLAPQGSMWFCAEMTINHFDMLILTAVLMFEVAWAGTRATTRRRPATI
ncbi:hypothetical protein QBC33DRAFT_551925 [Phialemonium atrogriseum]|uniref:Uncharacterized protein n=1 Tax=Phialemonium atrogriseum TaxID=1093897 RepID=A0AAJ0FBH1_9PEZI|nr:uncharacterized protein QBC33DRAFT_551925 [Phialemonium atrogriseum]KAK1762461.1 hypothetical protein QBC33DRAFT_551925 [Phialemonium atrogriseum]